MASAPPPGDPAPREGSLSPEALATLGRRPFGIYLHVPFCLTRCGYCDFNTYTAEQLGGHDLGGYLTRALAELRLARRVLGPTAPPASTVFVGGGTPTLLGAEGLARLLEGVRESFGLAPGAEVTTEANPETVTPRLTDGLLAAGYTRLSLGMQSAVPSVLAVLDRVHTPGGALEAVRVARASGFERISLDLIYGTPGESLDDWASSLRAALSVQPDHLSAYALIVEEGTRLAARIRRGEIPMPSSDDQADKYLMAEEQLTAAGLHSYEISNWAAGPASRCRHNLIYWRSDNWWGVGPGAHSHVGGVRWWNHRHPRQWASLLDAGDSPAQAREVLDAGARHLERVLLELRIADGLALDELTVTEQGRVSALRERGWLVLDRGRLRLTLQGRLLADAVTRELVD